MSVTAADIGTLYIQNYNGIHFTQPGGKGTQVFPAQANNAPMTSFPVPGQVLNEVGMSLWILGCNHGVDCIRIFKDYDSSTGLSVAVVCCSICSYIQRLISPYSEIDNITSFPIVIP